MPHTISGHKEKTYQEAVLDPTRKHQWKDVFNDLKGCLQGYFAMLFKIIGDLNPFFYNFTYFVNKKNCNTSHNC